MTDKLDLASVRAALSGRPLAGFVAADRTATAKAGVIKPPVAPPNRP